MKGINVAVGVALVGTVGVNIAYHKLQSVHQHRKYCTLPLQALRRNKICMQLLGGEYLKTEINLRLSEITVQKAKVVIKVKGTHQKGEIYAMSTSTEPSNWTLQYATLKIQNGGKSAVLLYPSDENEVADGSTIYHEKQLA